MTLVSEQRYSYFFFSGRFTIISFCQKHIFFRYLIFFVLLFFRLFLWVSFGFFFPRLISGNYFFIFLFYFRPVYSQFGQDNLARFFSTVSFIRETYQLALLGIIYLLLPRQHTSTRFSYHHSPISLSYHFYTRMIQMHFDHWREQEGHTLQF